MRVLVTGSNGLLGSRVVRALAARGHEPIATARGARRIAGPGDYFSADLTDAKQVDEVIKRARPEVIVNPAGMTDVDGCERDRAGAWAANVDAVASLSRGGMHVIHVSTDYVFDGSAGPYDVDATPNPRGVYATSKFAGELATKTLAQSWTIARTAVVYGWPAAARPNFGSWLVSTLKAGKPVNLFDDQWVTPSLGTNVAAMLAELAEKKLPGIFHVAGAEVVDRVAFGRALAKRFGLDEALLVPTHMRDVKLAIPRPVHSGLVVTKTASTLETKPLALAAALDQFYQET